MKKKRWILAWFVAFSMLATVLNSSAVRDGSEMPNLTYRGEDESNESSRPTIYLKAATFDTKNGEPYIQSHLKYIYPSSESDYYIVQFKDFELMTQGKKIIERLGGIFFLYVPQNTYIVKMATETKEIVEQLELVQWIGILHPFYKINPELYDRQGRMNVNVLIFEGEDFERILSEIQLMGGTILGTVESFGLIKAEIDVSIVRAIAHIRGVRWIEPWSQPVAFNEYARGIVQGGAPGITPLFNNNIFGNGEIIAITDSGLDINHAAFIDSNPIGPSHRKIEAYYVPVGSIGTLGDGSGHGTHVSGIAAGDDTTWQEETRYDGHALDSRIIVQDIDLDSDPWVHPPNDLYHNLFERAQIEGASIHTNSWGDYSSSVYSSKTKQIDEFVWDYNMYLILFAVGNAGVYGSVSTEANAKNIISVGASDNSPNQDDLYADSSRGPAEDERIKPDVIAPGENIISARTGLIDLWCGTSPETPPWDHYISCSGTSMATPAVAGAAALVREYFDDGFYPTGIRDPLNSLAPSAALLKAVLINGAEEINGEDTHSYCPGGLGSDFCYPNYDQGWGRVNLDNVLYFNGDPERLMVWDKTSGIGNDDTLFYDLAVNDITKPLEITLVWTDYEGDPSTIVQLRNNLDLQVTTPSNNVYKGNTFLGSSKTNPEPSHSIMGDSFWDMDAPLDGYDDRNNVEVIILTQDQIQTEGAGYYTIEIKGASVTHPNLDTLQPFALVATGGFETPPSVGLSYLDGWINTVNIPISLLYEDPEEGVVDGDLEFKEVPIVDGIPGDFGSVSWMEVGGSDGGDLSVTSFTGSNGYAYKFRFRAQNGNGLWSSYREPDYVTKIDTVPPNIPVLNEDKCNCPDDNSWSNDNEPHFYWLDPGDPQPNSGVEYYEGFHSVSGIDKTIYIGDLLEYSPTFADGIHSFKIHAVDRAGNVGGWSNILDLYIDTTLPDSPIVSSDTHSDQFTWYSTNDVTLDWTIPTDLLSGVKGYYYVFDEDPGTIPDEIIGTWIDNKEPPEENTVTIPGVNDGPHWFHIVAKDRAGNIGLPSHFQVLVDIEAPQDLLILINDGKQYTNSLDVALTLSASDIHSQVGGIRVKNEGEDWTDWEDYINDPTIKSWTLTEGADGPRTVWFQAKDNAIPPNEAAPVSATIIVDRIIPKAPRSLTASFTIAPHKFDISNVYLFWDLSEDDGAGEDDVVKYRIYRSTDNIDGPYDDDNGKREIPNGCSIYIDIDAGKADLVHNYFYKVAAVDGANNEGIIDELKAGKFIIPLYTGKNLVSTPFIPKDTLRDEVLKSIANNYKSLSWYNSAIGRTFQWKSDPPYPYYLLTNINQTMGFWIEMENWDDLVVVGSIPIYSGIKMYLGKNEVGYPSFSQITVGEAFNNFDIEFGVDKTYYFDSQSQVNHALNSNSPLSPGRGYVTEVERIAGDIDVAQTVDFIRGSELTPLPNSHSNNGVYHTIAPEWGELPGLVILDAIYTMPLTLKGEIWTFYLDAFFECENCYEGFTVLYKNPSDESWIYMLSVTQDWSDDPDGTIPSHKFEFPKGLFNNQNDAYIKILYECEIGPYQCIDYIHIDYMFIHTRSPGVWHIESQDSDVRFSSLDIAFSNEFMQLYEETTIYATIYNVGNNDIKDITMSIYEYISDTMPISILPPYQVVGESNTPILNILKKETFDIDALSSYTVSKVWNPGVTGLPKIYVVVDYNTEERSGFIGEGYREVIII